MMHGTTNIKLIPFRIKIYTRVDVGTTELTVPVIQCSGKSFQNSIVV